MILVNNINLSLDTDFDNLLNELREHKAFKNVNLTSARLYRKSVDARHKDNVHFCCSVIVEVSNNEQQAIKKIKNSQIFTEKPYKYEKCKKSIFERPLVVGFGPAGIFAAYTLAKAGLRPIVIERGKDVDSRTEDVFNFWNGGKLNPESNVQFGEGGAGAFSDGKLTTGTKDPRQKEVLRLFCENGAQENILTDAKPHIGTDVLAKVIKNIREEIISLGGDIRFSSRLEKINYENGKLVSAEIANSGETYTLLCSHLILAIGHSARDTFEMLKLNNVEMIRKPFAVGMRIEHSQKDLNEFLYGSFANHKALGSADYKLAVHLPSGRGVYTFCMCPGGEVVNASSEENGIAVNGMSYSARNSKNANSAILTEVLPCDLEGDDVLEGVRFQRELEQKAYKLAKGKGVPIQTVSGYLYGENKTPSICPSIKPQGVFAEITEIFPDFINSSLKEGIPLLSKKICGFEGGSVLIAPETRSSSPVRIVRNEELNSVGLSGLYPCGEGAGYAGGIMSAAVDGIKCAEAVITNINSN